MKVRWYKAGAGRHTTADVGRLARRIRRVERLIARVQVMERVVAALRAGMITAEELGQLLHGTSPQAQQPAAATDLVEERLIGLLDLALDHARDARQDKGAWQRLYLEVREALAELGCRPLFPQGRFDPLTCRVTAVEPAEQQQDHLAIVRVQRPAVVRDSDDGEQIVRAASVVVRDARVPATVTASSGNNGDQQDKHERGEEQ